MINFFKRNFPALVIVLVSLFFVISYYHFTSAKHLKFSDAAKIADAARNLYNSHTLGKSFTFYDSKLADLNSGYFFSIKGIPIANPLVVYISFKLLGISDLSVVIPSIFFFILSAIFIYLLGSRLSGRLVGVISSVAFLSNVDMLNYAVNGGSESLFIFEIILSSYIVSSNKKWSILILIPILIAMYFTRPQAFIFIAGLILYWLILTIGAKKALVGIFMLATIGFVFDRYVLYPLSFKTQVYSITSRGEQAILYYPAGAATSNGLRGGGLVKLSYQEIAKKIFYNIYNFYKLLPQIASPYMFALFAMSLFVWKKNKTYNSLKGISLFFLLSCILTAALTIPLIRYIHPAVPFVYLFAVDTLVLFLNKVFTNNRQILISSFILIVIFVVGQTLGVIFLDSRFERNTHNINEEPIYKKFSLILKENTDFDQIILTNLDTWGSWYGERRTVWYPLEPNQVIDKQTQKINFDGIYLTSYMIDDENYYMSESWRQIFNSPDNPKKWTCDGCAEISKQFKVSGIYSVSSDSNYEKQEGKAILLTKIK